MQGHGELYKTEMVVHDIASNSQRKNERKLIVKSTSAFVPTMQVAQVSYLIQNLESRNKKSKNKESVMKQEEIPCVSRISKVSITHNVSIQTHCLQTFFYTHDM